MVCRAKYSAIGASMARSTASSAVVGDHSDQSWASRADASTPALLTRRVMSSKLGTRAFPPRSPNETKPSLAGQISWVRPRFAPRRQPRNPLAGNWGGAGMLAENGVSCMETSTRCGRPVQSPVNAANAASGPVWAYPDGSVHRTGARSGSPVQYMLALAAITPRSLACQPARGPVPPNAGTLTHTPSGATAGSPVSLPGHPG